MGDAGKREQTDEWTAAQFFSRFGSQLSGVDFLNSSVFASVQLEINELCCENAVELYGDKAGELFHTSLNVLRQHKQMLSDSRVLCLGIRKHDNP